MVRLGPPLAATAGEASHQAATAEAAPASSRVTAEKRTDGTATRDDSRVAGETSVNSASDGWADAPSIPIIGQSRAIRTASRIRANHQREAVGRDVLRWVQTAWTTRDGTVETSVSSNWHRGVFMVWVSLTPDDRMGGWTNTVQGSVIFQTRSGEVIATRSGH